jgi:hypothetical protein
MRLRRESTPGIVVFENLYCQYGVAISGKNEGEKVTMMSHAFRCMLAGVVLAGSLLASKKVVSPTQSASSDDADLGVVITLAQPEVAQKIGADPGPGIVLVEVHFTNRTDHPIQVGPDDFILLAHDDGERNHPFSPAEIAGKGALVLHSTTTANSATGTTTTVGLGGIFTGGSGAGNHSTASKGVDSQMDDKKAGNDALLAALKAKQLADSDVKDTADGFLYFSLNGKHKLKDLALLYRGRAGKITIEFEH